MALANVFNRAWVSARWPLFAALAISLAGLFLPHPAWLGFLFFAGLFSAFAISNAAPWLNEGLALFFGLVVNVAVWAALIVAASAIAARVRRSHAAAH
jgi:hypothetical protein